MKALIALMMLGALAAPSVGAEDCVTVEVVESYDGQWENQYTTPFRDDITIEWFDKTPSTADWNESLFGFKFEDGCMVPESKPVTSTREEIELEHERYRV